VRRTPARAAARAATSSISICDLPVPVRAMGSAAGAPGAMPGVIICPVQHPAADRHLIDPADSAAGVRPFRRAGLTLGKIGGTGIAQALSAVPGYMSRDR